MVNVLGQRRLRTDKHGALDAGLFPALGGGVEGVDDGVGGDAEDPADGGEVALQDGEVELGVCSWRGRFVGGGHDCGVGFVVGDGGDAVGGMAVVPRLTGRWPTHGWEVLWGGEDGGV